MKKIQLGNTTLKVTELCFGALPMGPAQKNQSVDYNANVVAHALKKGINFVDTAEMYKTYEPISKAIKLTGIRPIIASKSNNKTYKGMEHAVNEALTKLNLDYIDIFHLHAAREGENAFELFSEALKCLVDMKAKGKVKAIGISTHSSKVTAKASTISEIDVVFPIINLLGMGIIDGSRQNMEHSINRVVQSGKGVYLMKVLSGGGLLNRYEEALTYAKSINGYSSISLGMTSIEEVNYNIAYFNGEKVSPISETCCNKKALVFNAICKSCGNCIDACPNNAITLNINNKASIDKSRCVMCGYCTPVCPEFAIRVV